MFRELHFREDFVFISKEKDPVTKKVNRTPRRQYCCCCCCCRWSCCCCCHYERIADRHGRRGRSFSSSHSSCSAASLLLPIPCASASSSCTREARVTAPAQPPARIPRSTSTEARRLTACIWNEFVSTAHPGSCCRARSRASGTSTTQRYRPASQPRTSRVRSTRAVFTGTVK